jgi:hypothetical protein
MSSKRSARLSAILDELHRIYLRLMTGRELPNDSQLYLELEREAFEIEKRFYTTNGL